MSLTEASRRHALSNFSSTFESAGTPPPSGEAGASWTGVERFVFRIAFSYFAMFGVSSLLDVGPAPRALLAGARDPIVRWFGHALLGLTGAPQAFGVPWAIAQQIAAIVVAVVMAIVWSLMARRTEYRRLNGWFRIALRYYVGVVMLVYGGFKVIDTQFPPPSLELLSRPVGGLSPMALLWTYMGASPVYAAFAGLGECVGGFLLFFRRTTTAGALVLVAVLSNVALINYAYDVPVKQLSSNLLIAAIVLALADARRLIAVFVLNEPFTPASTAFPLSAGLRRARRVLKPIIVVLGAVAPLTVSFFVHRSLVRPSPLRGVYAVEQFSRHGSNASTPFGDSLRWRTVIFDRSGAMAVKLATDSVVSLVATIDTVNHRITARGRDGRGTNAAFGYAFGYTSAASGVIRLHGVQGADSIDVTLRRLPPYRLINSP